MMAVSLEFKVIDFAHRRTGLPCREGRKKRTEVPVVLHCMGAGNTVSNMRTLLSPHDHSLASCKKNSRSIDRSTSVKAVPSSAASSGFHVFSTHHDGDDNVVVKTLLFVVQ